MNHKRNLVGELTALSLAASLLALPLLAQPAGQAPVAGPDPVLSAPTPAPKPEPTTTIANDARDANAAALGALRADVVRQHKQLLGRVDALQTKLETKIQSLDRSLMSGLLHGYLSDRFNAFLNSVGSPETAAQSPFWAVGILSIGLLALKLVALIAKKDSPFEPFLGCTFSVLVSGYLLVITAAMFWLAISAPGSPAKVFGDQVAASAELTSHLQQSSKEVATLIARLDALDRSARVADPSQHQLTNGSTVVDDIAIKRLLARIDQLAAEQKKATRTLTSKLDGSTKSLSVVEGNVGDVKETQLGFWWTLFANIVAGTALIGLALWLRSNGAFQ